MPDVRYLAAALVFVLLGASTAFAVTPGAGADLAPVDFRDTLATGMTGVDVSQAQEAGYAIPRAEVFYSQYRYVVGYYGIAGLADGLATAEQSGQFGQPLAVFVSDYSDTQPRLTPAGFVRLGESTGLGWVRAEDAAFVIDSGARTPGGPAVLPFESRVDARTFADAASGEVVDWPTVRSRLAGQAVDPAERLSSLVANHTARADAAVAAARGLRDRPVSVTVGDEADTLAAAVAAAPPNTTVRVPAGRHEANLTVHKPLTISGVGSATVLDGGGSGSLLTVRSPRVAVTDLSMTGVGERLAGSAANATGDRWDERIRLIYGRGDAAIRLADAHGSLVADVEIDTPSNGIAALNTSDAVVRNVTVRGSDTWQEGFMGVLAMYSDLVVEESTLVSGRDGVYTHHAHGIVVRDNTMRDARFGVHEMFTSDALVLNNTVRNEDVGLIVMTRPAGNALVGNDVRGSDRGVSVAGSASFVVGNVFAGNDAGLSIGTDRSYYARNTIVDNGVGIRDETLLPTNDVTANDVVGNDRYVDVGGGTRNVWAHRGRGNYWGDVPGLDRDGDGVVDRAFRPADPVDRGAVDSAGAAALAHSPAVASLRGFQAAVPGLRSSSLVDPAPLASPARPGTLDALNATAGGGS